MNRKLSLFGAEDFDRPMPAPVSPPHPEFTDLAPSLTDELAAVWGLPLGRKVRVELRDHAVPGLNGVLQVAALPNLPFDPRAAARGCADRRSRWSQSRVVGKTASI